MDWVHPPLTMCIHTTPYHACMARLTTVHTLVRRHHTTVHMLQHRSMLIGECSEQSDYYSAIIVLIARQSLALFPGPTIFWLNCTASDGLWLCCDARI